MSRKLRLWPQNRSRNRNFLFKYSSWSNKGKLLWSTLEIAEMKDEKIDTFGIANSADAKDSVSNQPCRSIRK